MTVQIARRMAVHAAVHPAVQVLQMAVRENVHLSVQSVQMAVHEREVKRHGKREIYLPVVARSSESN